MGNKVFKVVEIKSLLNQVMSEKITFSRFVEILNESVNPLFNQPTLRLRIQVKIDYRISELLKQMKDAGHRFISDADIDELINNALLEELYTEEDYHKRKLPDFIFVKDYSIKDKSLFIKGDEYPMMNYNYGTFSDLFKQGLIVVSNVNR